MPTLLPSRPTFTGRNAADVGSLTHALIGSHVQFLTGSTSPMMLVGTLGGLVPEGFTLELMHAGPDLLGTVLGLTGGKLEGREEITLASPEELRVGVLTKSGRHLLTAFTSDKRSVLVPTEGLVKLGGERRQCPRPRRASGRARRRPPPTPLRPHRPHRQPRRRLHGRHRLTSRPAVAGSYVRRWNR